MGRARMGRSNGTPKVDVKRRKPPPERSKQRRTDKNVAKYTTERHQLGTGTDESRLPLKAGGKKGEYYDKRLSPAFVIFFRVKFYHQVILATTGRVSWHEPRPERVERRDTVRETAVPAERLPDVSYTFRGNIGKRFASLPGPTVSGEAKTVFAENPVPHESRITRYILFVRAPHRSNRPPIKKKKTFLCYQNRRLLLDGSSKSRRNT